MRPLTVSSSGRSFSAVASLIVSFWCCIPEAFHFAVAVALSLCNTFSTHSVTHDIVQLGKFSNVRFFRFGGMSVDGTFHSPTPQYVTSVGANSGWYNVSHAANMSEPLDKKGRPIFNPFHDFSATCMYFGIEYTAALIKAGTPEEEVPPVGLIQSAVGGTHIEAWMDNETLTSCSNISDPGIAHNLYYGMVCPFVNMSVDGFVWYQV